MREGMHENVDSARSRLTSIGGLTALRKPVFALQVALLLVMAGSQAQRAELRPETWIDLLPSIDPAKDTVAGVWTKQGTKLQSSGQGQERIEIPYVPPAEYDFRITFTKVSGENCILQLLAHGKVPFIWVMSTNGMFTFHYLQGFGIGPNRTTVEKRSGIKSGRRYVSMVRVRNGGAEALLDGKVIATWPTDYSDAVPAPFWSLRDSSLIGLASGDSETIFHKVEVREVSGPGRFTR
jgi:hypothetical protein